MIQNTPIRLWAEDDRPREKMLLKGKNALSNSELLAIILGSGTKNLSAVQVAQMMLQDVDNDINKLSQKSIDDFKQYAGIGQVRAIELVAVMELIRRTENVEHANNKYVRCARDSFTCLKPYFADLTHEEFYVIYLNRANRVLKIEQLSKGGRAGTVADGKIIFEQALSAKASAIILAHNHPSGQLKPSAADIQLTKSLSKFGKYIDIQVLDHLIIAENNYFSFADEGTL